VKFPRLVLGLLALLGALDPAYAKACLGPGLQRYVFQARKPAHLPRGLTALDVELSKSPSRWEDIEVSLKTTSMDSDLPAGSVVRVQPGRQTSCSRWGDTGEHVYVVGLLVRTKDGVVFSAVQLPSVSNFQLESTIRTQLLAALARFGYSDVVARAAILIAEARLDDYSTFSNFTADVLSEAKLLDPSVNDAEAK